MRGLPDEQRPSPGFGREFHLFWPRRAKVARAAARCATCSLFAPHRVRRRWGGETGSNSIGPWEEKAERRFTEGPFLPGAFEPRSGGQESELDCGMAYEVDFVNVSTVGLESSPVAAALAGLRANEARYFKNKYGQAFVVEPAKKAKKLVDYVHRILKQERDIVIASRPLEAAELHVEN